MKKVGVIISGCGFLDGAEIQETVATLAALENHDLEAVCFAPDKQQIHVVNHLTQSVSEGEERNILVEAARIVRGNISPLEETSCDDLDAVMIPGGFGVAKNLSDYAFKGADMQIDPLVESVLKRAIEADKPVAAVCIAPILLAKLLGDRSPNLTLGAEGGDSKNLESLGGKHKATSHEEVVVDEAMKLVTGPCYMLDASVGNIIRGADAVVAKLKSFL